MYREDTRNPPTEAGLLLASAVPLRACCRSDCAPSRGASLPLDGARLRGWCTTAGRLRRKQTRQWHASLRHCLHILSMGIFNCRHVQI
jgi:hypothetical protein